MTNEELQKRKERAERETFIISPSDDGFRIYSPERPTKSYTVSGGPDNPRCTCLDFEGHEDDPDWRCKHILAVIRQFQQPAGQGGDAYAREERSATKSESTGGIGIAQMLLKRSVSPDGKIDSLSVEFAIPVGNFSVWEIRKEALDALGLQAAIVDGFLGEARNGNGQAVVNNNYEEASDGSVPAQMLNVGGMMTRRGWTLFINVQVNGQTARLFGSRKALGEHVSTAGFPNLADRIEQGVMLNIPCRVIANPSQDGRYLNIERVLPDRGRAMR